MKHKNKNEESFFKELKENRKLMKKMLKPKIDYDNEYDIFYLWFGGNKKVNSTIEVDEDMRFDITKDGLIVSVEIENLMSKLRTALKKDAKGTDDVKWD